MNSGPTYLMTFIDTPRLRLRPLVASDLNALFGWFSDPRVMRYYPGGAHTRIEQTQERLTHYMTHQQARGYAKWLVLDRETGEPVGDAGLMELHDPGTGWIDLGYRFGPSHWGRGLATEVATAWIAAASSFGVRELGAFTHAENLASQNVLRKVGFIETRRDIVMGIPAVVYRRDVLAREG